MIANHSSARTLHFGPFFNLGQEFAHAEALDHPPSPSLGPHLERKSSTAAAKFSQSAEVVGNDKEM
jgi:hypothetical protein